MHTQLANDHMQAPVGFDKYSYGYRDIKGTKVHQSVNEDYGGAFFLCDMGTRGVLVHAGWHGWLSSCLILYLNYCVYRAGRASACLEKRTKIEKAEEVKSCHAIPTYGQMSTVQAM
jgi:hypothetical protein